MTEYAYSRKEPCISSTTSMSRMRSSKSSGGGVFVLRRAIAAATPSQSLPGHERGLTGSIVDRPTDNVDHDPSVRASRAGCPAAPTGVAGRLLGLFHRPQKRRTRVPAQGFGGRAAARAYGLPAPPACSLSAYAPRELRQLSARL